MGLKCSILIVIAKKQPKTGISIKNIFQLIRNIKIEFKVTRKYQIMFLFSIIKKIKIISRAIKVKIKKDQLSLLIDLMLFAQYLLKLKFLLMLYVRFVFYDLK